MPSDIKLDGEKVIVEGQGINLVDEDGKDFPALSFIDSMEPLKPGKADLYINAPLSGGVLINSFRHDAMINAYRSQIGMLRRYPAKPCKDDPSSFGGLIVDTDNDLVECDAASISLTNPQSFCTPNSDRKALTHSDKDELIINQGMNYKGGVEINGITTIRGQFAQTQAEDIRLLFYDPKPFFPGVHQIHTLVCQGMPFVVSRTDKKWKTTPGSALDHDPSTDVLRINQGIFYKGGTEIMGDGRIYGNALITGKAELSQIDALKSQLKINGNSLIMDYKGGGLRHSREVGLELKISFAEFQIDSEAKKEKGLRIEMLRQPLPKGRAERRINLVLTGDKVLIETVVKSKRSDEIEQTKDETVEKMTYLDLVASIDDLQKRVKDLEDK